MEEAKPLQKAPSLDLRREVEYYQAVEEFFVSRRGDPLILSNADWLLIRNWRVAGIPLRVVLRGISDALDAHSVSWARRKRVGSLHYCAAEVEAARDRFERATGEGAAAGDVADRLKTLKAALLGAQGLGEESLEVLSSILSEWPDAGDSSPREIEAWLSGGEKALLKALSKEHGEEAVERARADVEGDLAPYRSKMPEKVADQIRKDALSRHLLSLHALPRLSLFG